MLVCLVQPCLWERINCPLSLYARGLSKHSLLQVGCLIIGVAAQVLHVELYFIHGQVLNANYARNTFHWERQRAKSKSKK